jgi:hypothetical protein
MREIKFRSWDSDKKVMIEWFPEFFSAMSPVTKFGSEFPVSGGSIVLMQYTGIKDKNGVEIYEGDIMAGGDEPLVVVFDTEDVGSCGCCYSEFKGSGFIVERDYGKDGLEVIGNIYKNHDLLSAGKGGEVCLTNS